MAHGVHIVSLRRAGTSSVKFWGSRLSPSNVKRGARNSFKRRDVPLCLQSVGKNCGKLHQRTIESPTMLCQRGQSTLFVPSGLPTILYSGTTSPTRFQSTFESKDKSFNRTTSSCGFHQVWLSTFILRSNIVPVHGLKRFNLQFVLHWML